MHQFGGISVAARCRKDSDIAVGFLANHCLSHTQQRGDTVADEGPASPRVRYQSPDAHRHIRCSELCSRAWGRRYGRHGGGQAAGMMLMVHVAGMKQTSKQQFIGGSVTQQTLQLPAGQLHGGAGGGGNTA